MKEEKTTGPEGHDHAAETSVQFLWSVPSHFIIMGVGKVPWGTWVSMRPYASKTKGQVYVHELASMS